MATLQLAMSMGTEMASKDSDWSVPYPPPFQSAGLKLSTQFLNRLSCKTVEILGREHSILLMDIVMDGNIHTAQCQRVAPHPEI
jgi:hypothetical protein